MSKWNPWAGEMHPDAVAWQENAQEQAIAQGGGTASQQLAHLNRQEWEDWKKRFLPRIEDMANQAMSGELTEADIKRADGEVMSSFDSAADAQKIRDSRLGIQRDSRQAASSERLLGLSKTAARASTRNNTRIAGQDRDMQILAGSGNIGLGANQ